MGSKPHPVSPPSSYLSSKSMSQTAEWQGPSTATALPTSDRPQDVNPELQIPSNIASTSNPLRERRDIHEFQFKSSSSSNHELQPSEFRNYETLQHQAPLLPERQRYIEWVHRFKPSRGGEGWNYYRTASNEPPISASSLSELEMNRIVENPRLRHDINFDRDLHFRPNLDGERGKAKRATAEDYWKALETELEIYAYMLNDEGGQSFLWTQRWTADFRARERRLPNNFGAIKDILKTLMPEHDKAHVDEALDVPLIMQQIERRMFDLAGLASWLAQLLKAHCAPMRDQWVDNMVELMVKGSANFDARAIVEGLKELFGILEAMKLDVANHQIRHLRPSLLEDTVRFGQIYWFSKIKRQQLDLEKINPWCFQANIATANSSAPYEPVTSDFSTNPRLHSFIAIMIDNLMPSPSTQNDYQENVMPLLPYSFKLDGDRLLDIRTEIYSYICTNICIFRLDHMMRWDYQRPTHEIERAKQLLSTLIPVIVGRCAGRDQWVSKAGNLAAEIAIVAGGNVPSSQSNGFVTLSSQHDPPETSLHDSFAKVDETERWLSKNIAPSSHLFKILATALRKQIVKDVMQETVAHIPLSPTAIFESFVPLQGPQPTPPPGIAPLLMQGNLPERKTKGCQQYDEILRRTSHIATLHWKVWGPIIDAYEVGNPEDENNQRTDSADQG